MKTLRILAILAIVALGAYPVIAHHPAADIVDEEIYEMIDAMVADTPHADMVFDDMGGGMTEIEIAGRVTDLEMIIEDGLLSYVALLDGDVSLTIDFTSNRAASMTIIQDESTATADKAATDTETVSLGELKASYR
jgi:hypothetical protein